MCTSCCEMHEITYGRSACAFGYLVLQHWRSGKRARLSSTCCLITALRGVYPRPWIKREGEGSNPSCCITLCRWTFFLRVFWCSVLQPAQRLRARSPVSGKGTRTQCSLHASSNAANSTVARLAANRCLITPLGSGPVRLDNARGRRFKSFMLLWASLFRGVTLCSWGLRMQPLGRQATTSCRAQPQRIAAPR